MSILSNTELLKVSYKQGKELFAGQFVLEPLLPGYGLTIGHALRRVLLSSLGGAAITSVRIDGVTHEFSTLPGLKEDIVEIILNLKSLRLRLEGDEPATLRLEKKGPGEVKAKDFQKNAVVKIVDENHHIATLDKNGKLVMEVSIKKGHGYEPVENRTEEKLPLGTIAIDSIFTPIKKIHYEVENTRVGGMTNYDKLTLEITTDGSITPTEAFSCANQILIEHFNLISERSVKKSAEPKIDAQMKLTEQTSEKKSKLKKAVVEKKNNSKIKVTKKVKKWKN